MSLPGNRTSLIVQEAFPIDSSELKLSPLIPSRITRVVVCGVCSDRPMDFEEAEAEDVAREILVRLDAKDVLRCKSVCKSWYSLISSCCFAKAHLKRSLDHKSRHEGHYRIINVAPMNCVTVGSSNGLVCISPSPKKFVVTNPFTREVRELEPHPKEYMYKSYFGFGYDSCTDDYKVVVGIKKGREHSRFLVLTLKSNIWKSIGDVHYVPHVPHDIYGRGILHNGALHWFVDDPKNNMERVILCFDLSLEKFKEIRRRDADNRCIFDSNLYKLGISEDGEPCIEHLLLWGMENDNSWKLLPCDDCKRCEYGAATCTKRINSPISFGSLDLSDDDNNAVTVVKSLVSPANIMPKIRN